MIVEVLEEMRVVEERKEDFFFPLLTWISSKETTLLNKMSTWISSKETRCRGKVSRKNKVKVEKLKAMLITPRTTFKWEKKKVLGR